MKYHIGNILIIFIICIITLYCIYYNFYNIKKEGFDTTKYSTNIPIVVICWNNYYFVKHFINQIKKYKNPIILLDNYSSYNKLLEYYKIIKNELKDRIEIRLLKENYGHKVYQKLKDELPKIYILSDPDLELNKNMPINFADILLELSNKYKSNKVGCALSIEDNDLFIKCDKYIAGHNIYEWEIQFWDKRIKNNDYELYYADTDTTFCLINNNYSSSKNNIRIAGDFTVKHLPWYDNYIKNNLSENELNVWKSLNKSSTILKCLNL